MVVAALHLQHPHQPHYQERHHRNDMKMYQSSYTSPPTSMMMMSAHDDDNNSFINDISIKSNRSSIDIDSNSYLIDHLHFMQEQEETYYPSTSSSSSLHPSSASASFSEDRRTMISWSYDIVDACSIDREMATIGMSYFDRFLLTSPGISIFSYHNHNTSRRKFQLAYLTCLVIALKCRGGMQVDSPFVSETICQGMYTPRKIVEMERTILEALQWKLNGPSPQEFVSGLLQLLPSSSTSTSSFSPSSSPSGPTAACSSTNTATQLHEKLKTLANKHIESSMLDYSMARQPPSRIAYAALLVALSKLNHHSTSVFLGPVERYGWMHTIASVLGISPTTGITSSSREVRQQQPKQRRRCRGDELPSSSDSSPPSQQHSASSYYCPISTTTTNRRHSLVGNVVSADYEEEEDMMSVHKYGRSNSSGSTRCSISSSRSNAYATPDRRGSSSSSQHPPSAMMHHHLTTESTSMITEYYCTPVGAVLGISSSSDSMNHRQHHRYCTPISNSSSSTLR